MRQGIPHRRLALVLGALMLAAPACAQMFGIGELDLQAPDASTGDAGWAGSSGAFPDAPSDVSRDQLDAANDTTAHEADAPHTDAPLDGPIDSVDEAACPFGTKRCAGECVSTNQVATGCSGASCDPCWFEHAAAICESGGGCAMGACVNGYEDCDGNPSNGCETSLRTDPEHCGGCAQACSYLHATSQCTAGDCVMGACESGWGDCDNDPVNGCEIEVAADPNHCGTCGLGCAFPHAGAVCAAGVCHRGACSTDYLNCDGEGGNGCEVYAKTDPNHCGSCTHVCNADGGTGETCKSGVCTPSSCPSGTEDCDGVSTNGCETDLNTSVNHCGTCGYACQFAHATATCTAGICHIAACSPGFGNCDNEESNGCETDTTTSLEHCGVCGNFCAAPPHATVGCASGTCKSVCVGGYADCVSSEPGCETNTESDPENCGACGRACASVGVDSLACDGGVCRSTCSIGFANCSWPAVGTDDGCELSVSKTHTSCGGCNNNCTLQGAGFVCGGTGLPDNVCSCSGDGSCNPHGSSGTCQPSGLCHCKNKDCKRGEQCELDSGGKKDECSCNGAAACGSGMTCCQSPPGCTDLESDAQSCGACGRAYPAGFVCKSGSCACSGNDSCNAGSAGTCSAKVCVCASQTCASGKRCLASGSCG